jgi:4,5-DOPA dioxygenase extradiol
MSGRMPALFIGHGNPMNALLANPYTQRWAAIGATLPRPKAILSVSAHWYIEDAAVTVSTTPRTIHDFGGFPHELYQLHYPAPGDPNLAARISGTIVGAACACLLRRIAPTIEPITMTATTPTPNT